MKKKIQKKRKRKFRKKNEEASLAHAYALDVIKE